VNGRLTANRGLFGVLLAPLLLATLVAPAAGEEPAVVPSDPVFVAQTTDGNKISGRIRQFGPDGSIRLVTVEGPERVLALDTLVKLTREGINTPLTPEAAVVLFPDGDRIHRATLGASTETALDVQSFSLGTLSVPLESLLGLVFTLPTDADAVDSFVNRVREEKRSTEVLWLANGDRLTGGFLGLTDKSVQFQPVKEPVKIDRSGVLALGFDPALAAYPKPVKPFLELTFSDGTRLGLTNLRLDQGHLIGTTRFNATVRGSVIELTRVTVRTPSIVYLSERLVAAEKYVPYIGPARLYRRDANVEGRPIRLSGQDYDRGLGTQSRTLLAYRLEPGDQRFQALVGLDDRAGPLGSVVFRVLVDNQERYASPALSARDAPRTVDVDVRGARALILITEFGDRGGVRDLADWAEARLIR
jgi:hypothetical protein